MPALTVRAQSPDETARFEKLVGRYEKILLANPKPGTAFDLWYQRYLDAGRLEDLVGKSATWVEGDEQNGKVWLLRAMVLDRIGRSEPALTAFRRAEALLPGSHLPAQLLGRLLARNDQPKEAAEALQRALASDPPPTETLQMLKQLGRIQLQRGEQQAAIQTWDRMAELFPDDRSVLEELAELLSEQRLWDAALERWQQLGAKSKNDPAARLRVDLAMANIHAQQDNPEAAISLFNAALLRIEPDSWQATDVRRRVQEVFLRTNDSAGWIAFWEARHRRFPDQVSCRLELARVLAQCDREKESLDHLRAVANAAPGRRDVQQLLIDRLRSGGLKAEAIERLEDVVRRRPTDDDAWALLGELHLEHVSPEDREDAARRAVQCWQRVADRQPQDPAAALRAAELCRRSLPPSAPSEANDSRSSGFRPGDAELTKAAERLYREAERRSDGDPRYNDYLGQFLHYQGKANEAMAAWSRMIQSPNDGADARRQLAQILAAHGYLTEATRVARQSVELSDANFSSHAELVRLLLNQDRYTDAIGELPLMLGRAKTDADWEEALELERETWRKSGQSDPRIRELRRLLVSESRNASPERDRHDRRLLASMLEQKWQYGDAESVLASALENYADDPRLLSQHAEVLRRQNQLDRAADQLRKLMQVDRRNRTMHGRTLIQLQLRRGKLSEALAAARQMVDASPGNLETLGLLADLSFRGEDPAGGIETLRTMVRLAPRDVDQRLRLATALMNHGDPAEAKEHYWRCFELSDSFDQKRSLVLRMAEGEGGRRPSQQVVDQIVDQLRSPRFRSEDPSVARLCAAALLRRVGRSEDAMRILEDVLASRPNNVPALRELADLARSENRPESAAEFQGRLAELSGDRRELEMLASDYVQADMVVEAVQVWQRVLEQSGGDAAIVRAVDLHIAEGALEPARRLAEWGAKRLPDSWALRFRAAYANLAEERIEEAKEHFVALLSLAERPEVDPPSRRPVASGTPVDGKVQVDSKATPPALSIVQSLVPSTLGTLSLRDDACPALLELQQAELAYARFQALGLQTAHVFRLRHPSLTAAAKREMDESTRRKRAIRWRTLARLPAPSSLSAARIEALVADYLIACDDGDRVEWELSRLERAEGDPTALRELVLVGAVARRWETIWDELDELVQHDKRDALPHLVRVTAGSSQYLRGLKVVNRRAQDFASGALRGYRWLRVAHPTLARQFRGQVVQQLTKVEDAVAMGELLRSELQGDAALNDVAELAAPVALQRSAPLRLRILEKAAAAPLSSSATTDADDLGWIIAVTLQADSLEKLDDAEVDHVVALLGRLLRLDSPPASVVSPTTGSGALRGGKSSLTASQSHRGEQFQLLYLESVKQENSDRSDGASSPFAPLPAIRPPSISSRMIPPSMRSKPGLFSSNWTWLGPDRRDLLQRVHEKLSSRGPDAVAKLQRLIKEGGDDADERTAARFRMAEVCLQWWRDERGSAIKGLESLSQQFPDDDGIWLTLATAYYARKQLRLTVAALDEVNRGHPTLARAANALREDVMKRWSGEALIYVLEGHRGVVRSIAFNSDGKRLASASVDRTVAVWDVKTGRQLHKLEGHNDIVLSVVFSADGELLASSGYDGMVRIWDPKTGEARRVLMGGKSPLRCVAFSPNGKTVTAASDDGTIYLWNEADGKAIATFREHNHTVLALAHSRDGKLLASGDADSRLRIWDLEAGECVARLDAHQAPVSSVAFSTDGATLYSASGDGQVIVWRRSSWEQVDNHLVKGEEIRAMAVSADGKYLACGGENKTLNLLRIEDWRTAARLRGHSAAVQAVAFANDGRQVASASYDGNVHIWEVEINSKSPPSP